jgi:hypothetical protein
VSQLTGCQATCVYRSSLLRGAVKAGRGRLAVAGIAIRTGALQGPQSARAGPVPLWIFSLPGPLALMGPPPDLSSSAKAKPLSGGQGSGAARACAMSR